MPSTTSNVKIQSLSKFEFIMSIVSVVLAVAATEFLSGWGKYIRSQQRVQIYPLYLGWSVALLGSALIHWSGMWAYANLEFNSLRQLIAIVTPGLVLAFSVHLIVPEQNSQLSLREQYARNAPRAFPVFGLFLAMSPLSDLYLVGSNNSFISYGMATFAILSAIVAAKVKSPKLDAILLGLLSCYIVWALGFDASGDAWFTKP
ncbi:MAG: hypothetical protein NXH95_11335 [Pseudomonadaceae bacterium]|nr:hypothetical protein [Pseudomonadaceae bacterium]